MSSFWRGTLLARPALLFLGLGLGISGAIAVMLWTVPGFSASVPSILRRHPSPDSPAASGQRPTVDLKLAHGDLAAAEVTSLTFGWKDAFIASARSEKRLAEPAIAQREFTGATAQELRTLWNALGLECKSYKKPATLEPDPKSPGARLVCFTPSYQLRFVGERENLVASMCWACGRVEFQRQSDSGSCEFNPRSPSAIALKARLRGLMPQVYSHTGWSADSPDDSESKERPAAPVAYGEITITRATDPQKLLPVGAIVDPEGRYQEALAYCYDRSWVTDPELAGTLVFEFDIARPAQVAAASGAAGPSAADLKPSAPTQNSLRTVKFQNVKLAQSTIKNEELIACAKDSLQTEYVRNQPLGGLLVASPLHVRLPIKFQSYVPK